MGQVVDRIAAHDEHMTRASRYRDLARWEDVLVELQHADAYSRTDAFPETDRCQQIIFGMKGAAEWRLVRPDRAIEHLRNALGIADTDQQLNLDLTAELAAIYYQVGRYSAAKEMFASQYVRAEKLSLGFWSESVNALDVYSRVLHKRQALETEASACQAIGNLGRTNYQLSQEQNDPQLLQKATNQLLECVRWAKDLQLEMEDASQEGSHPLPARLIGIARDLAVIGYNGLTLAYAANGCTAEAVRCGEVSHDIKQNALSRFFHAYALLRDWQIGKAEALFRLSGCPQDMRTCAMALCQEPSAEHYRYLHLLVDLGIRMDEHDEKGYSALDYAVCSGSKEMEVLLCKALAGYYSPAEIQKLRRDAFLKRYYRKAFPDRSQPSLELEDPKMFQFVRNGYNDMLDKETGACELDESKLVRYLDFVKHGKHPSISDAIARKFLNVIIKSKQD